MFLAKALGLQDKISLWYLNGKPSDNTGELYSVARIHEYLNREARRTGLIDVTFAAKEDRERLLAQGYVIYCATRGHSFMIVPGQNKEGYIIPVMSQAGYDQPYESPNFSYKFIRPRSLSDIREDYPEDAIMWAVLLPNVIEPKNPYRTPLYDSKIPEGKAKNKSFELGWLTTIKDLKAIVGDKELGLFEKYIEGKKEKLPTGNHIFQFAFDVVQAIQNYKMPIGIDYSQDPVYFTNHIKKDLTGKGYGKIVNSEYADKIFSGIQARFVTKERSRIEGRFFQPLQCVDLHNLFSMAAKIPGAPVKINSLTGYAQDMAFMLFSGKTPDSSSGVIRFKGDRPTDLVNFKAGDSFFIAYDGDSDGHVGTIVTDPFVDAKGKITIGVADSNRHVSVRNGFPEIESDGMPRIRFMDYEQFIREYLTGRDNRPTGRMAVLRKR